MSNKVNMAKPKASRTFRFKKDFIFSPDFLLGQIGSARVLLFFDDERQGLAQFIPEG
jgi:hypothetical protein